MNNGFFDLFPTFAPRFFLQGFHTFFMGLPAFTGLFFAFFLSFPQNLEAHAISAGIWGVDILPSIIKTVQSFPDKILSEFDTDRNGHLEFTEMDFHREEILEFIAENFSLKTDSGSGEVVFMDMVYLAGVPVLLKNYANNNDSETITLNGKIGKWNVVVKKEGVKRSAFLNSGNQTVAVVFSGWNAFVRAFTLGFHHITTGYDHLLLLLSVLLVGRFREWLKAVTGFTVAHMISLYAGMNGVVDFPLVVTECIIAVSIAVIALLSIVPKLTVLLERSWMIVCAIGLIHGLGFAGYLSRFLPDREYFSWTVAGFNLGAGIGQIAFVTVFSGTFYFFWKYCSGKFVKFATVKIVAGYALCLIGTGLALFRIVEGLA